MLWAELPSFRKKNEIVIEFSSQEDLELLDMEFIDGKVPQLGANAYYDAETAADPNEFLQRYERSNIKS